MYNFRDLRIWRNARAFVSKIYLETRTFPAEEKHGLALQMRGAGVSITSNIAEGCGREGDKTVQQFLEYSLSSAFELETRLSSLLKKPRNSFRNCKAYKKGFIISGKT